MNDPMQELVCPKCGSDEVRLIDPSLHWEKSDLWCCDNCDGCHVDPESRAEYLAALEDQGREDR